MHPEIFESLETSNFEFDDQLYPDENGIKDDQNKKVQILKIKERYQTEDINRAIIKFFVKDRLPLAKMESPHFNNLINGTEFIIAYYAHVYFQSIFILILIYSISFISY